MPQNCAVSAVHPGGTADRRPGCHHLLCVPAERADQQADQDLADPEAGVAAEEDAYRHPAGKQDVDVHDEHAYGHEGAASCSLCW